MTPFSSPLRTPKTLRVKKRSAILHGSRNDYDKLMDKVFEGSNISQSSNLPKNDEYISICSLEAYRGVSHWAKDVLVFCRVPGGKVLWTLVCPIKAWPDFHNILQSTLRRTLEEPLLVPDSTTLLATVTIPQSYRLTNRWFKYQLSLMDSKSKR